MFCHASVSNHIDLIMSPLSPLTLNSYLLPTDPTQILSLLDLAKAVDCLLLVVKVNEGCQRPIIDDDALDFLAALRSAGTISIYNSYALCVYMSINMFIRISSIHSLLILYIGMPDVIVCAQGFHLFSGKVLHETKRMCQRILNANIYDEVKCIDTTEFLSLGRTLSTSICKEVSWRGVRSYLVAESAEVLCHGDDDGDGQFSISVKGYIRGQPMSVDSMMYIVGAGTCYVDSIRQCEEENFPARRKKTSYSASSMEMNVENPSVDHDEKIESEKEKLDLILFADGDALAGEQTWPTEEEMMNVGQEDMLVDTQDSGTGRSRRIIPTDIPVGMSDYQADWFVDENGDVEWDDDDEDMDEDEGSMEEQPDYDVHEANTMLGEEKKKPEEPLDEYERDEKMLMEDDDEFSIAGSVLAKITPAQGLEEKRLHHADDDREFPDEVDTPADQAARLRFARYRALQSFRSSPWHNKESLPIHYSKIFQFENFAATQRRVLAQGRHAEGVQSDLQLCSKKESKGISNSDDNGEVEMQDQHQENAFQTDDQLSMILPNTDRYIKSGIYVEIVLKNVPKEATLMKITNQQPLVVFNMLAHENKVSVVHYTIQRTANYDGIIKSKDSLVFMSGFRTFRANPIFSECNLNCDKHKFERFLHPDRFSVATVYSQITYLPSPVLVFKEIEGGGLVQVASGNLMSVDPDRIILKKIILTGESNVIIRLFQILVFVLISPHMFFTGLPVRSKKRFAVVKHMFYDPNDVRYYKPAELVTKYGLRGHIREPLGTHGLFKAIFSAPMKQNDTVMLILYKRVFPKTFLGGQFSI